MMCNATSKCSAGGTFQVTATGSNANSKCKQRYTCQNSVTWRDAWNELYASYFNRSMLNGTAIENVPVSCIQCKRVYLRRCFNDHSHIVRCEGFWERRQSMLRAHYHSKKRSWRKYHKRNCHYCQREIFSDRSNEYRVCWSCGKEVQRAAVRRCQSAQKKSKRDAFCAHCGGTYQSVRSTSRYCSSRCRVAAYRQEGE